MLQICRAEDGEVFQVNATMWDIEKLESLELFLNHEIGIDQDAVLAYLSDGRRLRNENIRDLAGAQDQSIFVFNKYYLDESLDAVLHNLHVQPPMQPPIEDSIAATPPFRPSQLGASYLRAAHAHHQSINHTLVTLQCQRTSLRIASSSLDLNVLAIADVFEGVSSGAQRELEKQATLLAGIDADLEMVGQVNIHRDFMSITMQRAMDAGGKGRTLGDYVSNAKMRQVADNCAKTHAELQARFRASQETMKRLTDGTAEVRLVLSDTRLLDEAEVLVQQSQDIHDRISDAAAALESPVAEPEGLLQELRQLDTAMRNSVSSITDLKNMFTEQCMRALRQISLLNHDLVELPPALTALQAGFRAKNAFSHIQRLHNMIYAYGATVIEIVRRKEFGRFFYQRSQVILEVMAKLTAAERKRRQVYRGEVHGQLPFDARGMDDPVPAIDFSPTGSNESDNPYTLERSDIQGKPTTASAAAAAECFAVIDLLHVLEDLERVAHALDDGSIALNTIRETRIPLEKLVNKMDGLESGFDRIAERSLLSSSRLALSRRRLSDADEHAFHELAERLNEVQQTKAHQENLFSEERLALQTEVTRLKNQLQSLDGDSSSERERADRLESELQKLRLQLGKEAAARRIAEERHQDLLSTVDRQIQELADARAEATKQTKGAEALREQLAKALSESDDLKALDTRNSAKLTNLLEDQEMHLRDLETARSRGEDLEAQIRTVREECEEARRALEEAGREKDRLLRAQASEHDRQMRDYVAEADGDRAVLEHQFLELRAESEDMERQMKEAISQAEMKEADAAGLREELQRLENELRAAQHAETVLREDYEQKMEESSRLVAQLLDVSIAYRTAHFKALTLAQAAISHPSMSKSITQMSDSQVFSTNSRHPAIGPLDEPSPLDPSDPAAAIEILRSFDQDHFLEVVGKTGSTIRKWQKQCKEYRERAKGKISFRNFAKGDLALFLPTRNSVSKPWAAFNVSFPHYFLQATGHLAEQLKSREWIVARITSITERVVDPKDPNSNPYGLGDGVKYYMLEVEDWTQPSSSKRRVTSRKVSGEPPREELPALSAPPENEVEESFQATRAPTSHLFPVVRARSNSSPTAGPSSLSRLLAQAAVPTDLPTLDPIPSAPTPARTPSPVPSPMPSPPSTAHPPRPHAPKSSSPLRPGSRQSRISTSSRFSAGRIPPFGVASSAGPSSASVVKAAPTTALSASPAALDESSSPPAPETPSPADSASDGLANFFNDRRRTTSYHAPRTASSPLATAAGPRERPSAGALASLASWSASFSRRRKPDAHNVNSIGAEADAAPAEDGTARALLQRF
ncbi:putative peripheral membrane protein [Artomyces pyxidatus]|uniref:Peripheral membrane protein n=1 Tax=Artomyces pyxidatus TaxID=48021 RepID=A0ACB8T6U4_9AGAM|nr:putative peripheral membrane protein [Artomyces pyxidatus]